MSPSPNDLQVETAYLGPRASFSNQAALEYFGASAVHSPKVSFSDIFSALQSQDQSSSTIYGVVPIENSTNGSVVQTLDLLADRSGQYPELRVCGELYLTVSHCLLAPKSSLPRAERLKRIKKLYTHPQAWGQCERFLSSQFKGIERQDVSSTSRAAAIVAEEGDESESAAIASALTAQAYGVEVLEERIEDRDDNVTRFFILKKAGETEEASRGQLHSALKWKTLISFTIEHTVPGALVKALMVFGTNGLNLTSINSRPSQEQPWHYVFLVECEGRKGDGRVDRVLDQMFTGAKTCRYWGSWKDELES